MLTLFIYRYFLTNGYVCVYADIYDGILLLVLRESGFGNEPGSFNFSFAYRSKSFHSMGMEQVHGLDHSPFSSEAAGRFAVLCCGQSSSSTGPPPPASSCPARVGPISLKQRVFKAARHVVYQPFVVQTCFFGGYGRGSIQAMCC